MTVLVKMSMGLKIQGRWAGFLGANEDQERALSEGFSPSLPVAPHLFEKTSFPRSGPATVCALAQRSLSRSVIKLGKNGVGTALA